MPLRRLLIAYSTWMVLLAALAAVFVSTAAVQASAITLAGLTGTAAALYGTRRNRPARRRPWYSLAGALLLSTLAQLLFRLLPGPTGTYQRGSAVLYVVLIAMYVLMIGGLIGLARPAPHDLTAVVDLAILLLGTGLLAGILVAVPYALQPHLPVIQAIARVIFVIADVVLLAALVHFATSEPWNASLALLVFGVIAFLTYFSVLRLQVIRGVAKPGTMIDLIDVLFAAAWGMAALLPSMSRLGERAERRRSVPLRLGLLIGSAVLPFSLLLIGTFRLGTPWYEPLVATVSAIMLTLVLAQLAGVALRLRNQVGGERALSHAVTEVAGAYDVPAVTTALEANVPLLGSGRATGWVATALYQTGGGPPGEATPPALVGEPPDPLIGEVGAGAEVVRTLCLDNGEGRLVLHLRGDLAGIDRAWPRLEVLATQACLVLDRIRLSRELLRRTIKEYVNALAQTSGDVILLVDDTDRITHASPSASAIFGTSELDGARLTDLVDESLRPAVVDLLRRARSHQADAAGRPPTARPIRPADVITAPSRFRLEPTDGVNTATWNLRRADGSEGEFDVACREATSTTDATVSGLLIDMRDVTEQRSLERDLTERASRDPLTGLVSGVLLRERVRHDIEAHRDTVVAMIVLDVDDFKLVNSEYGQDVGDGVLRTIAGRLIETLPPHALTGRISGDRFAVIVDIAASGEADAIATRLLEVVGRPIEVEHGVVTRTASAGVATTSEARSHQELWRQAELALLIARDAGKGRCHHYDPTARSTVLERLELRTALAHALEGHELLVEFQPVVDLRTGGVAGFEALLRWQHPTYGRLSPTAFIDVAEESGLIVPIGAWVLQTAMAEARRWESVAVEVPPFVAVNVSARQLESPDFCDLLARQLEASGLEASRLHVEITESSVLSEEMIWGDLARLREMGVQTAIDDFGTGYSALSYLGRVPAGWVKLDRQFVASMTANPTQRELVEGIVKLTRILELEVIAEGVETTFERDLVVATGCRYGQGFLFARPMSGDAALAWLAERRERPAVPEYQGAGRGLG